MVSEEIELAPYLAKHGIEALETDLGEFIVQIDHDHPSHRVGGDS
jgi:L-lactate dehydrogenase complex protein LldF